MADDANLDGLEEFLSKVDNIQSLITGLNSEKSDDAIQKADQYIDKLSINTGNIPGKKKKKYPPQDNTGVNRTVINHAAFRDDPPPPGQGVPDNMDPDAFMKVMEVDAEERHERRMKQRAEATVIKDEGNVAFKAGDYEKAVELYTKALAVVKDLTAVWTNRAQAYIKLGQYEEALSDCDWALRVDEKCLKAFVHRGRAYLAQGKYDEAIAAYTEGLTAEPTKEKAIKGYMEEVNRTRMAKEQEAAAQTFLEAGQGAATGLVELMSRVNKADQRAMFYAGGLRVVTQALIDDTSRTLFRTEGGLELVNTHTYISKCWSAPNNAVSREEADMLGVMLDTFIAAITDNDENQRRLLTLEGFSAGLLRWGETSNKRLQVLHAAVVNMVYTLSLSEFGQQLIMDNLDLDCVLNISFQMATVGGRAAIHAICCLTNISRLAKFKIHVRSSVEEKIIVPCEDLMMNGACDAAVLVFCFDALTNLANDMPIRIKIASRQTMWEKCCKILNTHEKQLKAGSISEDLVHSLLSMAVRLTPDLAAQPTVSQALSSSTEKLVSASVRLMNCGLSGVESRATGLLSHLLPPGGVAVNYACDAGVVPALVVKLQEGTDPVTLKSAMKALSACTQHRPESRHVVLDTPKALPALVGLLKSDDETLVGNAALCLGHMAGEERVAARLTKTNIVQHLLVKARDGHNHQLQHNCAILLAKLTQFDQRHLERLRELQGLGILHDVMKNVKT